MAGASPAIWVLGPAQRAPASGLKDMTGTSWAQAWGVKPAVSPSRLSSGVARRSEWACLAVDVLRDDRQRCACAGDGEVGRGPGVWAGWVQPLADRIRLDTARLRQRAAASGPAAPRRLARLLPPRTAPTSPVAAWQRSRAADSDTQPGWPSCTAGWPGTARRCMVRWPTGCSPTAPTSPARSSITSRGRRTSRAACGTGHRGCSCRRSAARLKAPAGIVCYEYSPYTTALSQALPVRGPQEKAALPTGPPVRVRHHRASGPVLRLPGAACPHGGGWSRPAGPGGSQHRLAPPSGHRRVPGSGRQHHPTGEAADIRHRRGGQWRASHARRKARAAKRQSRSARTSTTNRPTALPT